MPYLVSECLEGRNLRERLKSGPMPVAEAVAVALGVAQGLAAAHERGIVHRDLKPENTFLKSDGGIKLLDFGLAKLKLPAGKPTAGADDTALSLVAGTAAYMAPEQARGEMPDPRADLFALGVMMYEMLTGQHPFRGASVFETLHAILTRDPPDLMAVNERVPPRSARIVMRLLEKSPEARFQSARDLAWSLAQATDPTARPATDRTGTQQPERTRKWQVAAARSADGGRGCRGYGLVARGPVPAESACRCIDAIHLDVAGGHEPRLSRLSSRRMDAASLSPLRMPPAYGSSSAISSLSTQSRLQELKAPCCRSGRRTVDRWPTSAMAS